MRITTKKALFTSIAAVALFGAGVETASAVSPVQTVHAATLAPAGPTRVYVGYYIYGDTTAHYAAVGMYALPKAGTHYFVKAPVVPGYTPSSSVVEAIAGTKTQVTGLVYTKNSSSTQSKPSTGTKPAKSSAAKTPAKGNSTSAKSSATKTPAKGTTTSNPAKSSATKAPAKGTTTSTPVKSSATKAPAKGTTTSTPVKNSATKTPVKGTTTSNPAKSSATKTPAKGTTTSTPVKSSSTATPAKGGTASTPAKGTTTSTPTKETTSTPVQTLGNKASSTSKSAVTKPVATQSSVKKAATSQSSAEALPKAGDANQSGLALAGAAIIALFGGLGLTAKRREN
ncbi:LPXTG cell wall anchor domain-containing protein [Lacticaseibacillus jixiensis]|uniref:LPXTG cell wall anchor domain-containing protein n=1 Tax=Lacticaseibacillus jixiensis TaxID=3231926 RepID=UPI0036F26755